MLIIISNDVHVHTYSDHVLDISAVLVWSVCATRFAAVDCFSLSGKSRKKEAKQRV